MTVAAITPEQTYLGNGTAAPLAVPFRFLAVDDIKVTKIAPGNVQTVLVRGTDYSVAGAGGTAGTVTPLAVIPVGTSWHIKRVTARTQPTDYVTGDVFPAETHELALDRQMLAVQELDVTLAEASGRALRVPPGELVGELPAAALRAAKFISFDAGGVMFLSSGTGVDAGLRADLVSSSGGSLIAYIATGAGAVARTVQAKFRDTISGADFGMVGDGVMVGGVPTGTDNRAALAACVLAARGKRITLPEGNYLINTDGGTITLEEVMIEGQGVLDGSPGTFDQGVNLWYTGTTNSPFKVRRGVTIQGLGHYYPNQPDSATPVVYPVTFAFDFTNGAVQFVNFLGNSVYNAYRFIDIDDGGVGNVGHVEISGGYICALNRGIYISHNLEHIRIKGINFTFGHWTVATEAGSRAYMRANATAVQVDKSDGVEFIDNLMFGYLNGVLTSATGLCQMMNIAISKFDQVRYPVKAIGAGNFDGSILGCTFHAFNGAATTLQGRSISIETSGTAFESITIAGHNFDLATEDHIFVTGNAPTRKIAIGLSSYRSWAAYKGAGSYAAINVSGALTNVQVDGGLLYGSNFLAFSIGIMGLPNNLQVSGVMFEAMQAALSVTTNSAILTGNKSFLTGGPTSDIITATEIVQTGNRWDKPSGKGKHAFVARNNVALTFNSGTAADVTYNLESLDSDDIFISPSFTVKVPGFYLFNWMVVHDATGTAGDLWNLALVLNGSNLHDPIYRMAAAANGSVNGSYGYKLAVGDVVKLQMRRTGGTGNFVTVAGAYNALSFSGVLVN